MLRIFNDVLVYRDTNLAVRIGFKRFGCTAVSGDGGRVIVVGSSDKHARWWVLQGLQWRNVFAAVIIATVTAVVKKNYRVITGGGTAGSAVDTAATATANTVHRSPRRTGGMGRGPRQGVAAAGGRGQPVLDPAVVGRQAVELSDAFLQKALGRRARFRWITFRPKMVRQLPLADRVPFHRPSFIAPPYRDRTPEVVD